MCIRDRLVCVSGRAFCPCIGLYTCLCFREFHSPHESLPFQLRLNQHLFSADLVRRFWPMMLVASVTSHSSSISCRSASVHLCCSPVLAFHHLTLREFAGERCCRKPHIYHAERQQTMHYSMPGCAMGIEVFESSGRSCNDAIFVESSFFRKSSSVIMLPLCNAALLVG